MGRTAPNSLKVAPTAAAKTTNPRLARLDNPHAWPDKAQRVRGMFASVAESYDFLNHLHSAAIDVWWRRQTVSWAHVPSGGRVLDVCCGTADLTLAFARRAPQASVIIGSDFCHEMLVRGQAKLDRWQRDHRTGDSDTRGIRGGDLTPTVCLVEADALHLPFDDGAFDVVSCAFGLRNVADADAALREFHRVLAPGGRLVILEFTLPRWAVVRAAYQFYFRTVMPLTATILSGDRTGAYRYLPESVAHWPAPQELETRLQSLGFGDTTHHLLTLGIAAVHTATRP